MKFWADKGIDGFRLDAFGFASKDTSFPAFPVGFEKNFMLYYSMGPHLHEYLKEMNKEVFSKYKLLSVAEGAGNSFADAHNLVDADRKELNMAYAFEGVDIAKQNGYSLLHFKEVFSRWDSAFANNGWLSIFLANHDQARMVSRFGNDKPAFREKSSMLLSTFIMTMRVTPYHYNGDELGMTNAYFTDIKQYKDMPTLNEYQNQLQKGGDITAFMKKIQFECRDNGRTPFQWDTTINAGFSTGTPWLAVNPNYTIINKAAQEKDPNSVLNYFRKLSAFRKANPILVYGKYTLLDKTNPQVYAYTREWEGKKWLVLLNFSDKEASVSTGIDITNKKLILSNYQTAASANSLRAYEARIVEL
jgi:oligo-1,6-glucosidase